MVPVAKPSGNPLHAVVFTYPLQGHIIPAYNLAKKLAAKGVVITLVCTEDSHSRITKSNGGRDPFAEDAATLGLPISTALVSDGLPVGFDRSLHFDDFNNSLLNKMESHVEELMRNLQAKEPSISCIITDTFLPWADRVAKKFGVPHVSFWTQSAMVFPIYYNWDFIVKNGHHPFTGNEAEVIDYIPGARALKLTDLPSFLQESDVSTIMHKLLYEGFRSVHGADWIISNTVHELESQTIEQVEAQSGIQFGSVGPLISLNLVDGQDMKVGTSMWEESDCRSWLDGKAKGSVIYISFGSFAHVSKAQIEEMAMGLLQSKRPFVWVLRPDIVASDVHSILPEGFLDKCKEQGMVVQWTSQLDILSHPSVGGFLTHCGWNSIMESLWFGVPMLAFPLLTDQYTNCRLVVDEWGVAMRLGRTPRCLKNMRSDLVGRKEIAGTVEKFMHTGEEETSQIRANVESVREITKKAVLNGGSSSHRNLDLFVQELKARDRSRFRSIPVTRKNSSTSSPSISTIV